MWHKAGKARSWDSLGGVGRSVAGLEAQAGELRAWVAMWRRCWRSAHRAQENTGKYLKTLKTFIKELRLCRTQVLEPIWVELGQPGSLYIEVQHLFTAADDDGTQVCCNQLLSHLSSHTQPLPTKHTQSQKPAQSSSQNTQQGLPTQLPWFVQNHLLYTVC